MSVIIKRYNSLGLEDFEKTFEERVVCFKIDKPADSLIVLFVTLYFHYD